MVRKDTTSHFKALHQTNLHLLELVRLEQWDKFIEQAEIYLVALHGTAELDLAGEILSGEEKSELKRIWAELLSNEKEIMEKLSLRLSVLKGEMSGLNKGRKCSQAYSSQMKIVTH
ncbi:flagellar protein FliT [Erwinia typographi]|uniref:flagellar protein FliT n=1 Tax=Erwinia typographi TaxID=371042 RepID=UPI000689DD3C|nr:flagellar protein FliT [Erwinia typographi]